MKFLERKKFHKDKPGTYFIPTTSDEVLRLYVLPQYLEKTNNFKKNNLLFDNIDVAECGYTVNGIPKPLKKCVMDFTNKEWIRAFEAFLDITRNDLDTAPLVDYLKFGELYPIMCFDLSHHEPYTYIDSFKKSFNYKLRNAPNKEYILFHFVMEVKKHTILNMKKKQIDMINSLTKS